MYANYGDGWCTIGKGSSGLCSRYSKTIRRIIRQRNRNRNNGKDESYISNFDINYTSHSGASGTYTYNSGYKFNEMSFVMSPSITAEVLNFFTESKFLSKYGNRIKKQRHSRKLVEQQSKKYAELNEKGIISTYAGPNTTWEFSCSNGNLYGSATLTTKIK